MIDLTKIGQTEEKVEKEKIDDNTYIINGRQVKTRSNFSKQELEGSAWTIDKFVQDGQVQAKPDDGKKNPNTEWIPDDKNSL